MADYKLPKKYALKISEGLNKLNINSINFIRSISSWNDYQKKQKIINKLSKNYNPPEKKYRKFINNVVQANKKLATINFRLPTTLFDNIKTWNDFQKMNKFINIINKNNALDIVKGTKNGKPLFRFEVELLKELPVINKKRLKRQKELPFSYESGTMGNVEYHAYSPKKSIVDYSNPTSIDIHKYFISLIKESLPSYYTNKDKQYYLNFISALNKIPDDNLRKELTDKLLEYTPTQLFNKGVSDALLSLENFYDELSDSSYNQKAKELLDAL